MKTATLDIDATVIACDKRAAKRAYDGNRGYQPVLALWAEQDVIVVDEFRDGNVPAGSGNRRVVEKAIAALPGGLDKIYLRGDSALYEHDLMRWLDEQAIGYAISADMSPQLAECISGCRRITGNPTKKKPARSASGPRSTICRATRSGARMPFRRAAISPSASARARASCTRRQPGPPLVHCHQPLRPGRRLWPRFDPLAPTEGRYHRTRP